MNHNNVVSKGKNIAPIVGGCCDRRSFLRGTLAVCAAAFFPGALARGSSQLQVFLQEMPGLYTGDAGSGLGMLLVQQPAAIEAQISKLRKRFHFRSRLRHSTNKFQRDFADNLLDYFLKEPDLSFAARVLIGRPAHKEAGSDLFELYKFHYKQFLRDNLPINEKVLITVPDERKSSGYQVLQDLKSEFPAVDEIIRKPDIKRQISKAGIKHQIREADIRHNDLLDLSGYIARYVFGETPNPTALSNRTKVEILHHLRSGLRVTTLIDPSLSQNRKFKILTV